MKVLILLLAATSLTASPALAQHQGHHMPAPKKPAEKKPAAKRPAAKKPAAKKPAAKKPGAKKAPVKKAQVKKAPIKKTSVAKPPAQAVDPHSEHDMPAANPHAGHAMPEADPHAGHAVPMEADPHAAHAMPVEADPHAGHAMASEAIDPPVAGPPAEALSGPAHAADLVYGSGAMALSRKQMAREHGDLIAYRLFLDRAEARLGEGTNGYAFDGDGWIGGDIDKLWIKTEGEGDFDHGLEGVETQALWSHAITPFFDLQAGARYDASRGPDRAHLVIGLQGLAPYWIEVDAAAFLSNKGDVTASVEAEHDVRITQTLILQPRGEADLAFQDVPELAIGAGLSEASLGARLRYQVTQTFAPYVGAEYARSFGNTRRFRKAEGEDVGGWRLLVGLRSWF